ncbi:DUF4292 domain-containing protein [Capnocytophaga sp. ARDL2]|uniref:DUF4292 domain-containing protein n=1 Tax=Capnocytophaga sp. ARDL2 TaxID=3238809 RepID=UPI0035564343
MKKTLFSILLLTSLVGCKTQKIQPVETNETIEIANQPELPSNSDVDIKHDWEAVYNKHIAINRSFNTAQIQATVDYADTIQDYNIKADIRIEKGKQILINMRYFLINVGKIYISPERISYYEIATNTHYDGNFELLQQMFGVKVDYQQVENIFLGETFFDVSSFFWETFQKNNQLEMKHFAKAYTLSINLKNNGELISQEIDDNKGNSALLKYYSFQNINQTVLPKNWSIDTKKKQTILLNYDKIEFDGKLNFKYEIPSRSKPVKL